MTTKIPNSKFQILNKSKVINSKFYNSKINWKLENEKWEIFWGFSLIEMLVVVMVFGVLGVLVARIIILTTQGSNKNDAQVRVRENLGYALAVIERQLRNASSITACSASRVDFLDGQGMPASFSCETSPAPAFVASVSARLTSSEVNVTSCHFTCSVGGESELRSLNVSLVARDVRFTGVVGSQVTIDTTIYLRNY